MSLSNPRARYGTRTARRLADAACLLGLVPAGPADAQRMVVRIDREFAAAAGKRQVPVRGHGGRIRIALTSFSLVCALAFATSAHGQARRVDRIDYVVSDARQSADFYEKALGFEREGEVESDDAAMARIDCLSAVRTRTITLRLGNEHIGLVQYLTPPSGRPWPAGSRSQDRWFQHFAVIVSHMDQAFARLSRFAPEAISRGGPQTLPQNTGSVTAYKFRDPDGHPLELLYLPPGTGRPIWHRPTTQDLFLGIDHTTIGSGSTAHSLSFYRDLLGFKVVGGILNQGVEQERLDDAPGATVRITPVRPAEDTGPGVEFIEYVRPDDGRDAPADTRPNDLWAARIELVVDDLAGLASRLSRAGVGFVSPGVVPLQGHAAGSALVVLDPDGHRVLLLQR